MNLINIKIITPKGLEVEKKVRQATIPTADGEITVLANHAPLISILKEGEIILKGGDVELSKFKTLEGFVEVRRESELILLSDLIEEVK